MVSFYRKFNMDLLRNSEPLRFTQGRWITGKNGTYIQGAKKVLDPPMVLIVLTSPISFFPAVFSQFSLFYLKTNLFKSMWVWPYVPMYIITTQK